jgi:acetate kinase
MKIMVLNAGSSSVKYQFLDMTTEQPLAIGKVERVGMDDAIFEYKTSTGHKIKEIATILDHTTAVRKVLAALTHPDHGVIQSPSEIAAVGHRVVHGGEHFNKSVLVDDAVRRGLQELFDLAPLHNPANLMGILAAEASLPGVPQVAVFDTAYHATMPRTSFLYALPYSMYKRHNVRRYGFHGTSHSYVAERYATMTQQSLADLKIVSCHLGNGASCCAILHGKSFDTSMGFTPLEGLIMGTRSGDLDPGVISYIMNREEISIQEVNSMLNKHSGMLGLSGITGDMRQLEEEANNGDERATETIAMFEYRLRKYIGSYAAGMNGLDAVIFTGGIGENSSRLREMICLNLSFLGIDFDATANSQHGERAITTALSTVGVWVIPTNEELVIARDSRDLIQA